MKRINVILQSNKEPEDKNIIWLKDKKLYIWEGGWEPICDSDITVNPEDITVDLSEYLKKTEANSLYQLKGNYALVRDIPTKVSQLTNDSRYITVSGIPDDYVKQNQLKTKQDVLTAGEGINITNNVIKCTLDTSLYKVVVSLPSVGEENKIYLVESKAKSISNVYIEYAYINGQWETLGEYRAEINLEPYALKSELPTKTSQLENDSNFATKAELPQAETYVLNFTIKDGVNTGAYDATEYANLRSAIENGKLIIIGGAVTRVTADSQAMAADYVVIRYSTPRISDDNKSVTISFYELKFGIIDSDGTYKYQSKAIHKTIS